MVSVQKKLRHFAGKAVRKARRELRVSKGNVGITVVIPMYNSLPYIEKTIASILEQDYDRRDVEVLVIDDGSTDGSSAYIDDVASRYPGFLRVIHIHETWASRMLKVSTCFFATPMTISDPRHCGR